jgi:hypothetical protein
MGTEEEEEEKKVHFADGGDTTPVPLWFPLSLLECLVTFDCLSIPQARGMGVIATDTRGYDTPNNYFAAFFCLKAHLRLCSILNTHVCKTQHRASYGSFKV